jgi:formylglycine-generating enzyme required for sulfatase activity
VIDVKWDATFPLPLPDNPQKWDGWSRYKSDNPYERLCLDPRQNPSNELIEEHCRELLRWWQKKLPLKNQPSNPLSQLLRSGLDESSRYLTEARVELLDPVRRKRVDEELAAQAQQETIAEFHKFLAFSLADGLLTTDEESALFRFGAGHGLSEAQMRLFIEQQLKETGATRAAESAPAGVVAPQWNGAEAAAGDPKAEFIRMLRLSGLDSEAMTDDQRDAFINVAENSGLDPGEAEDMVDAYLEQVDQKQAEEVKSATRQSVTVAVEATNKSTKAGEESAKMPAEQTLSPDEERRRFNNYVNSIGGQMFLIPSSEFTMGSDNAEAAPNEKPQFLVGVSRFYISRFPITNQQYEEFDPAHKRKRAPGAGDRHPVVYVSSLEAIRFCQWLSTRERKKYRLPTEAEWEYAAKGNDGREYPWGNFARRGDLANFADKNTVFAWSDPEIDDGFAESSPVGSFARGASPFGVEDMAGNVWEWCIDYFEQYKATPKTNPRGPTTGNKRVYRGGSWKSRFASLRATARSANAPNYSCNDLGFRIVCECESK